MVYTPLALDYVRRARGVRFTVVVHALGTQSRDIGGVPVHYVNVVRIYGQTLGVARGAFETCLNQASSTRLET